MILDGWAVQRALKEKLKQEVKVWRSRGIVPSLDILVWEKGGAAAVYAESLKKFGEGIEAQVRVHQLSMDLASEKVRELIEELNLKADVHGILPLTPFPPHLDKRKLGAFISPLKDVDALNPCTLGELYLGKSLFSPSTALAVIRLLDFYGIEVEGKKAVILGRSQTVGKPLALLLLNRNATVTVCHSHTKNLAEVAYQGELLISAMGVPRKVDRSFVRPRSVVVDVGTTVVQGKILGDVLWEEVAEVASSVTPVPGGVGPVTTTVLFENLLEAVKIQSEGDQKG